MPSRLTGMYTIPPFLVKQKYEGSGMYFMGEDGSNLKYFAVSKNGNEVELDKDNLIHLNDSATSADNAFKGVSKLYTLRPAIENIRAAYKKRNVALTLPIGVFSQASKDAIGNATPMDPKEKKDTRKNLTRNNSRPIISGLALSYASLDANPNNMGLFEEVREDLGKICDAYGYPYGLLANTKSNSLGDAPKVKEWRRDVYESTIIPDMQERVDALNSKFETFAKSWTIQAMWSHLPVFSEDKKERATALKLLSSSLIELVNNGLITKEDAQAELAKYKIYGSKR
jgi:phage portal protein BeeE